MEVESGGGTWGDKAMIRARARARVRVRVRVGLGLGPPPLRVVVSKSYLQKISLPLHADFIHHIRFCQFGLEDL